jgi:hypothetical protein
MQSSSRLRYVDADEVGSEIIEFDDLKVRTPDGDKLGEVDGFIVDSDARRAYYVVVDSGGWFSSRKFLVPIGHARVDEDGDALVVDVARDTISRYPEFDRDSFERLGDEELRNYQRRYGEACCPDDAAAADDWNYETYQHYRQPSWWRTEYYNWDVPAAVGTSGAVVTPTNRRTALDDALPGDIDNDEPERHRLHERDLHESGRHVEATRGTEGGDVSPHLGGRAQPGDVLGIETGGETTEIGDTDEKEDKRRRDAEKAAGDIVREDKKDQRR